jgi:hypothetical protein
MFSASSAVQNTHTTNQCVLGTLADAYYRGYDVCLVENCTATTSPEGGLANVLHNAGNVGVSLLISWIAVHDNLQSYGFVTDTSKILASIQRNDS